LAGNLLDNALEAAQSSNAPREDMQLVYNKPGLELTISNTGDPISQDHET